MICAMNGMIARIEMMPCTTFDSGSQQKTAATVPRNRIDVTGYASVACSFAKIAKKFRSRAAA